jgi:hypothetical protein
MRNFGNALQNLFMHQRMITNAKMQDASSDMSDETLLGRSHFAERKEHLSPVILNSSVYFLID